MKRATSQTIVYEFTREEVAEALCEKFGLALPEPSDGWHTLELMQHGQETSEDCPFCNHSRAVSLFLIERPAQTEARR